MKYFYGYSPFSADSIRVVSYKQKNVHKVLVLKLLSQACPGKSVVR